MSRITDKQYKERARKLNRYLRQGIKHKKLTSKVKAQITREYNKHREYLSEPEAFKSVRVSERNIKQLKENGYMVTKTRAIIPKYDANDVVVRKNTIQHLYADKYTETLIGNPAEILEDFRTVFDDKNKNQFIAASFGGAGLFKNKVFTSYRDFMLYMSNFTPDDKKGASDKQIRESKEKLIAEMRLVTIPKSWRKKLHVGDKKKAVPLSNALKRFNK